MTPNGLGMGVEPLGINYPFVAPSPDIKGLFSDLFLSHAEWDAVVPFRVSWVKGFCNGQSSCGPSESSSIGDPTPTHAADLVILDANDDVVFDSTLALSFNKWHWGTYWIYEWKNSTAVCRVVVQDSLDITETPYQSIFRPDSAILNERTHILVPKLVTSLGVEDEGFTERVYLEAGYNMVADVSDFSTHRQGHTIKLSAFPGEGQGRYPNSGLQGNPIRTINNIPPDSQGRFLFSAQSCHWLERPYNYGLNTLIDHTLKLNNNCQAPCADVDYANVYRGLINVHEKLTDVKDRLSEVRDSYTAGVNSLLAQRECQTQQPTQAILLSTTPGKLVAAAASFCNTDNSTKYNITLVLTFAAAVPGQVVPCRTTMTGVQPPCPPVAPQQPCIVRQELPGSWPVYHMSWPKLDPGKAVFIKTLLKFPLATVGTSVTMTVSPYVDGVPQPTASASTGIGQCGG